MDKEYKKEKEVIRLWEKGKPTDIIFEPMFVKPLPEHDPRLRKLLEEMREDFDNQPF